MTAWTRVTVATRGTAGAAARRRLTLRTKASVLGNFLHLLKDPIDVKGRRLLPLREFPESLEELANDHLGPAGR
jgi:hypothetical protein